MQGERARILPAIFVQLLVLVSKPKWLPSLVHTCAAVPLTTLTSNEVMETLAITFAATSNMMPFRLTHWRYAELQSAPDGSSPHVGVGSAIGGPVGRRVVGRGVGRRVVGAAEVGLDEGFADVGGAVGSRADDGMPVVGRADDGMPVVGRADDGLPVVGRADDGLGVGPPVDGPWVVGRAEGTGVGLLGEGFDVGRRVDGLLVGAFDDDFR
jgi:hypothetical protein